MSASHQKVRYFSFDFFGVLDDNKSTSAILGILRGFHTLRYGFFFFFLKPIMSKMYIIYNLNIEKNSQSNTLQNKFISYFLAFIQIYLNS